MLKGQRYVDETVNPDFLIFVEKRLPYLSYKTACAFYAESVPNLSDNELAVLGCNDRFWLLTSLLRRKDAINEWFYDRAREVEADPDDHLDLWARAHGKSSTITFAGAIQEILIDPEITIGIFSINRDIAGPFLTQIKEELETNEDLKRIYADVLYERPAAESPLWSSSEGIVVKRTGNPKEATVEAHGMLEALPTGRHFALRIYDDMINEKVVTQTPADMVRKVTFRWQLSQNLGLAGDGRNRKQVVGTRYLFGDTYGQLMDEGVLTPRVYPATHNGKLDGHPVYFSEELWASVKKEQRSTVAAQMLLNPTAGNDNTFMIGWLRPYEIRPLLLNVYILGDPSLGRTRTSDRTAIAVIGVDVLRNRYLLDGFCHRMKLSQRWEAVRDMHLKWSKARGVQMVRIGYERYGLQSDTEYFDEKAIAEKIEGMSIDEVSWAREGGQAKEQRVGRLEPYFRNSQFWMPPKVWAPEHGGLCTWSISEPNPDKDEPQRIVYAPYRGPSRAEREATGRGEFYRVLEPIRRIDETGSPYDLFRVFAEEFIYFPFSPKRDLVDATSRIEDMQATPPMMHEAIPVETAVYSD